MIKHINDTKVIIAGFVKSVNYGQSQSGNDKVTVCLQDGEEKVYVNFINTTSAEYGDSPNADNAKTFFESKYFEKTGYVGRPVAIRASVAKSTGEDGTEYTNYFGSRLYNPKSAMIYRVPAATYYFGVAVAKNKDGKLSASLPANVKGKTGNWGQQWIHGTIDDSQFKDLAKVDGKCPYVIVSIVDGAFVYDKLNATELVDETTSDEQPETFPEDTEVPLPADEDDGAMEEELEFD